MEIFNHVRFKPSEFTRNAFTIFSGTFFSQVMLVAATPFLTRWYSPADFGELALFTSWYSILVGLFTLKFELSILLPPTQEESIRLVKLTIWISALFSSICLVVLGVLHFTQFRAPGYFFFLPLLTLAGATNSALQQWFSRNKRFSLSATSSVINSAMNILFCMLLLAIPGAFSGRLVFASNMGIMIATSYYIYKMWKSDRAIWRSASTEYSKLYFAYQNFAWYMVPTSLLGVLSYQIIPLLLQRSFSMDIVGYYSIASRFLFLPSVLLGTAIGEVFRVETARQKNENTDLRPIFRSTLKKMLFVGIPVFTVFLFFAPMIFRLVLGEKFATSGIYAQFLCLAVFGQFLLQPFRSVYIILQEMKYYFMFQVLLTLVPIMAIAIGGVMMHSVPTAFLLISFLTMVVTSLMIMKAYRLIASRNDNGNL